MTLWFWADTNYDGDGVGKISFSLALYFYDDPAQLLLRVRVSFLH